MTLLARQKAFFLVALQQRSKTVEPLFDFLAKAEVDALAPLYQSMKDRRSSDIEAAASAELKKFSRKQSQTYLAEVHNDWMVDALKIEPPCVIATVLRYLPAERVSYILDHLPEDVLKKMPRIVDSFDADAALVEVLRQRFESQFELNTVLMPGQGFEFEHVPLLRAAQIQKLFLELGYNEIALGLTSLPFATQKIVLGRLGMDDRQRVETAMQKLVSPSAQRIKKAQVHLVSKEVEAYRQDFFVREIGYLIYAKALLLKDHEALTILKHKLAKSEAKVLQGFVEQYSKNNTEASVLPYREDVLMAAKQI